MRPIRVAPAVAVSIALVVAVGGCGSDEESEDFEFGTEFGRLSPEDQRVSAAEVAAGISELARYAEVMIEQLGSDVEAAIDAQEKLTPIWETILGTIKDNDEQAFRRLRDAVDVLVAVSVEGDQEQGAVALQRWREVGESYLDRFPVTATASPDPARPPSPSSAVVPSGSGTATPTARS